MRNFIFHIVIIPCNLRFDSNSQCPVCDNSGRDHTAEIYHENRNARFVYMLYENSIKCGPHGTGRHFTQMNALITAALSHISDCVSLR
jgi:hypothetical protein